MEHVFKHYRRQGGTTGILIGATSRRPRCGGSHFCGAAISGRAKIVKLVEGLEIKDASAVWYFCSAGFHRFRTCGAADRS